MRYYDNRMTYRIITERKIREFYQNIPAAENAMHEWIKITRASDWSNFADLRRTFNYADVYKNCVIFDVGGNKYRIIGKVAYRKHLIFIRFVMTHSEYDENEWREDCK